MEAHFNTNYYFKMIIPQRNWVSNKSGESSSENSVLYFLWNDGFWNYINYKLRCKYISVKIGKSIKNAIQNQNLFKAMYYKHKSPRSELHLLFWTYHSIKIWYMGSKWWHIPN